jgi:hypothetical protein
MGGSRHAMEVFFDRLIDDDYRLTETSTTMNADGSVTLTMTCIRSPAYHLEGLLYADALRNINSSISDSFPHTACSPVPGVYDRIIYGMGGLKPEYVNTSYNPWETGIPPAPEEKMETEIDVGLGDIPKGSVSMHEVKDISANEFFDD